MCKYLVTKRQPISDSSQTRQVTFPKKSNIDFSGADKNLELVILNYFRSVFCRATI